MFPAFFCDDSAVQSASFSQVNEEDEGEEFENKEVSAEIMVLLVPCTSPSTPASRRNDETVISKRSFRSIIVDKN